MKCNLMGPLGSNRPLQQKKPTVSWAELGGMLPEGQGM